MPFNLAGCLAGTIAAALATALAYGFLGPAGIKIDKEVKVPFSSPEWKAIKLRCSDCGPSSSVSNELFESESEKKTIPDLHGGAHSVLVNITTLFDGTAIGIGGHPLYPSSRTFANRASFEKASVDIISADTSLVELQTSGAKRHNAVISAYHSTVCQDFFTSEGHIITINYQIRSLNNYPVTVEGFMVTCVKHADNTLTLVDVALIPNADNVLSGIDRRSTRSKHKQYSLAAILCVWKDYINAQVSAFKCSLPKALGGQCPGWAGAVMTGFCAEYDSEYEYRGPHGEHKGDHDNERYGEVDGEIDGEDNKDEHRGPHGEHKGDHDDEHSPLGSIFASSQLLVEASPQILDLGGSGNASGIKSV